MVQAIVTPGNLGTEFDLGVVTSNKITLLVATTTTSGKVSRLATAADVSAGTSGPVVDAGTLKAAIAGLIGGLNYQGTWNPVTNSTPTLLSGAGTKGYLYKLANNGVVNNTTSTAASTNTTIAVASATGVVAGQSVTGTGVPVNPVVTVVSVSGNNVTVSSAVNIASGAVLTFATYLDSAGPFYAGDSVVFDGTTWDKFDSTGETSLNVTDAFGNHLYYAAP